MNLKETFDLVKEQNGQKQTVTFAVKRPTPEEGRKAQASYNQTFGNALKTGALLRARIDGYMREQNLWDDSKEAAHQQILSQLSEMALQLKKGGIKLSEAKKLAIQMREKRAELRTLIAQRNQLDLNTAEGQAENARFNALVSMCLVYNDSGEPVYKSLDEYLQHAGDEEAFTGAQTLAQMMFTLDKEYEANLPENQFLKKWKFVDNQLRLVNKDGHLVDEDGRLINEDGHYVDADNNLVDKEGRRVDEKGNYVVEAQPFLDDDGNPIVEETEAVEVKKAEVTPPATTTPPAE